MLEKEQKIRDLIALSSHILNLKNFNLSRNFNHTPSLEASVLILLGLSHKNSNFPQLLLTQRTDTVDTHRGQIAFPGGVLDPLDQGDPVATALRESKEEVGLDSKEVWVTGVLPKIPTVSTGFLVTPVLGVLQNHWIEDLVLTPNVKEIDHYFWVSWEEFFVPGVYQMEWKHYQGVRYPIHHYFVRQYDVWGATGYLIHNLLERYQSLR